MYCNHIQRARNEYLLASGKSSNSVLLTKIPFDLTDLSAADDADDDDGADDDNPDVLWISTLSLLSSQYSNAILNAWATVKANASA